MYEVWIIKKECSNKTMKFDNQVVCCKFTDDWYLLYVGIPKWLYQFYDSN